MAYGLIVRNAANVICFDSTVAAGGVCVTIVTAVPGAVYSYPNYPGRTGMLIPAQGTQDSMFQWTVDYALGYPRFTFGANAAGTVALFIK